MNSFVTNVANLVKEECHTAMLHGDMNISRLMVYAQSIEESKLSRIYRNFKRSGPSEKNQLRFKKWDPIQDEPKDPKVKLEKGSGSENGKPTSVICGKKHYRKCLGGIGNCFTCGKDGHEVRDCPTIADRIKKGKQVPPSVPGDDVPRKNRFYALRARGSKADDEDYVVDREKKREEREKTREEEIALVKEADNKRSVTKLAARGCKLC
ncbi:uncharacterized protein LOC107030150 [Solanum pennellii]|uniref:Uncharacterized protein LOC107030150 n=1 Tax=Solanum pennellii TaxID=28526 RepID=A0ABM1HL02_SOLPN|nr:uncharacterized protein LOC107030150 [Solanum pennellii]